MTTPLEDTENRPYITTAHGPSGYFAALMAWSSREGGYTISQAGPTRSKKRNKIEKAAKLWAESAHLEYRK